MLERLTRPRLSGWIAPLGLSAALVILFVAGPDVTSSLRYERAAVLARAMVAPGRWAPRARRRGPPRLECRRTPAGRVAVRTRIQPARLAARPAGFDSGHRRSGSLLFEPQLEWYVGFSGVLHGCMAAGLVAWLRTSRDPLTMLVTVACCGQARVGASCRRAAVHRGHPEPAGRTPGAHLWRARRPAAALYLDLARRPRHRRYNRRAGRGGAPQEYAARCRWHSSFPARVRNPSACSPSSPRRNPSCSETFAEASDVLGYDLWALCQHGPEADLGATEKTQPAMLAAGVATWRVWRRHGGPRPVAMAGPQPRRIHGAGVLGGRSTSGPPSNSCAIRGQVMQEAVPLGQGAMAAILGLDDADIEAACREAAQGEVVEAGELQFARASRDRRPRDGGGPRDGSGEERAAPSGRRCCRSACRATAA